MIKLITPLTQVDTTTPQFTVGTKTQTSDGNEYIYCQGVGSVAIGSAVTYNHDYAVALTDTGTGSISLMGPLAIAQSASNGTTKYGWFLVRGEGEALSNGAIAKDARLQPTAALGYLDDTTVGSIVVIGLWSRETAGGAGSTFTVQLDYPKIINVTLS